MMIAAAIVIVSHFDHAALAHCIISYTAKMVRFITVFRHLLNRSAAIVLLNAVGFGAFASDDLFSLSLEELQQVEISVASMTDENLQTVPSTVTVFTRGDIQRHGISDVYHLLNFVPGLQVTRGERLTSIPKPQARGIFLDNGYLLFLINGKRMNEVSFGKASVFHPNIPIDWIEQVEIIRGPGSAIYGSNAFMGVVNIITRKDSSQEIKLHAGNYGSNSIGGYLSNNEVGGSVIAYQSNGATYSTEQGRYSDPQQSKVANLFWETESFYADLDWMQYNYPENINLGGLSADNEFQSENMYSRIGYKTDIYQTFFQVEGQYIQHEVKSAGKVLSAGQIPNLSNDFLVGPWWKTDTTQIKLNASHNLTPFQIISTGIGWKNERLTQAGIYTTHLASDQSDAVPNDSFYLGSVKGFKSLTVFESLEDDLISEEFYIEWRTVWSSQLHSFIGMRYDNYQDLGDKTVPRISLIYQPADQQRVRLQYAESFRSPVFNELYSNDSVTVGNSNLKPESVSTLELEWLYDGDNSRHQIVVFENKTEDFIVNIPLASDPTKDTFVNQLSDTFRGIEYEGLLNITRSFELRSTFSHMFQASKTAAFENVGSLTANYISDSYLLGSTLLYRSNVYATETDYRNGEYALVGLHGHYKWQKDWIVGFKVQNAFDEDVTNYERRFSNNDFHMPDSPQSILMELNVAF